MFSKLDYYDHTVLFYGSMKMPTLKQLRYFVALTEEEHFGRAAEACFVSQTAFSNAIRELETTLDQSQCHDHGDGSAHRHDGAPGLA